jgi:small GTP-binding protein
VSARKKIMLLGDIGVGKTSLIRRLVFDKFEGTYRGTLGFDLFTYALDGVGPMRDQRMPIILWDTDGNLGVNILRHDVYMDGTSGALVIADAARPETHAVAAGLATAFIDQFPGRPLAFVLNKSDLIDASPVAPSAWVPLLGPDAPVVHTSAKSGSNVLEAFRTIASAILRRGGDDDL